jgi:hypothetical protein
VKSKNCLILYVQKKKLRKKASRTSIYCVYYTFEYFSLPFDLRGVIAALMKSVQKNSWSSGLLLAFISLDDSVALSAVKPYMSNVICLVSKQWREVIFARNNLSRTNKRKNSWFSYFYMMVFTLS